MKVYQKLRIYERKRFGNILEYKLHFGVPKFDDGESPAPSKAFNKFWQLDAIGLNELITIQKETF